MILPLVIETSYIKGYSTKILTVSYLWQQRTATLSSNNKILEINLSAFNEIALAWAHSVIVINNTLFLIM